MKKHDSLKESKSQKLLRSTRSLSPRPPIRHQKALISLDSKSFNIQLLNLSKAEMGITKHQIIKTCRSEQFSPNIIDGTNVQFSYNKSTNRSTSCIASKFDIESITRNPSSSSSVKPASYLNEDTKTTSVTEVKKQLQSAPSSPQFLNAVENIFTSSTYINNQNFNRRFDEKSPIQSPSFSPARTKESHNHLTYDNFFVRNSPPPSISVEINNKQIKSKSKLNLRTTNYEFLNVCNPNFLNARHSFSSVYDQLDGEELQLNIRRLSDQMSRKDSIFPNTIKTFSSDCNVTENQKGDCIAFVSSNNVHDKNIGEKVEVCRADFSEYLEQFRCSEAKKAAIEKENELLWKENISITRKPQKKQKIAENKSQQSSECLLETTC
ncbi:uncharacterized protein ACRADG_001948 [Cochliomyia hominivorax]